MTPEQEARINAIMDAFAQEMIDKVIQFQNRQYLIEEESFREYESTLIECLGMVRMLINRGMYALADQMLVELINKLGPLDPVT